MMRPRRSLEEQLADAKVRQAKVAARLSQLEARRKVQDARTRAWGEKVLIRVILEAALQRDDVRALLEMLIEKADLKSKEREAAQWLLAPVSPLPAPANEAGHEARAQTG